MKSSKFLLSICLLIIFIGIAIGIALSSKNNMYLVSASSSSKIHHHHKNRLEPPFRCFRPFSQLRAFSAKDMNRGDNCEFAPFQRIINASATVNCYSPHHHPDPTGEGRDGCYVTLNLIGEKFHPQATGNFHPTQFSTFLRERDEKGLHLDAMRYAIELKALGSSTVRYKGFGKTGYSVCCSMIKKNKIQNNNIEGFVGGGETANTTAQEEICDWVVVPSSSSSEEDSSSESTTTKELRVKSQTACPLNDPAYDPEIISATSVKYSPEKYIYSEITRPLHRKIAGKWEARIEFYKDDVDEGIGRVVIPFHITEEQLGSEEKTQQFNNEQVVPVNQDDGAAAHGGVVAVASAPKHEEQEVAKKEGKP